MIERALGEWCSKDSWINLCCLQLGKKMRSTNAKNREEVLSVCGYSWDSFIRRLLNERESCSCWMMHKSRWTGKLRKVCDWRICCSCSQNPALHYFQELSVPARAMWFCLLFSIGRYINSFEKWAREKKNESLSSNSLRRVGKRPWWLLPAPPPGRAFPPPA